MGDTISIKNLREEGGRFFFDVIREDELTGEMQTGNYFTNRSGEGIFSERRPGDIVQHTGTCQFSLNGVSDTTRRRRIRAFFA